MPKRNLILILAIAVAAVITVLVNRAPREGGPMPGGEFSPVAETYDLIRSQYYGKLDCQQLQQAAVRAMVQRLDEHSTYVEPERVKALSHRVVGGMDHGVGLRLEQVEGRCRVVGPLIHSPAYREGVFGPCELVTVDGKPLAGLELAQVQALLDGPNGSRVSLGLDDGHDQSRTVTLTRGEFPVETVEGLYRDRGGRWVYLIDPDSVIAYVRVSEFVNDTGEKLTQTLRQMPRLEGLVLDLRGNPGGLLPAALEVANAFLHHGVIVTMLGRRGSQSFAASESGTWRDIPVVVLIDEETASAAEIVAGALKLHGRAVLIGSRTHGKGTVQTMFSLGDSLGQLNLTTSEFLVAGELPITRRSGQNQWGIDPHIAVELSSERAGRLARLRVECEVMPAPPADRPQSEPTTQAASATPHRTLLSLDSQLARALTLLAEPKDMERILEQDRRQRPSRRAAPAASTCVADE